MLISLLFFSCNIMAYETTVIVRNRAQCLSCGSVVESVDRSDFVQCKCGALSLEGGTSYVGWLAKDSDDVLLLTEYRDKDRDDVLMDISRFQSYKRVRTDLLQQAYEYLDTLE